MLSLYDLQRKRPELWLVGCFVHCVLARLLVDIYVPTCLSKHSCFVVIILEGHQFLVGYLIHFYNINLFSQTFLIRLDIVNDTNHSDGFSETAESP